MSASLADGSPLPDWLQFDAANRTLSGLPPLPGQLDVRFTAASADGGSVSDSVSLTVQTAQIGISGYSSAIDVAGDLAALALGYSDLGIFSLSDPRQPQSLAFFSTPGECFDVLVQDGLAFLAAGSAGLQIVDLADPVRPRLLSGLSLSSAPYFTARSLTLSGGVAFVAAEGSGLFLVDVRDPEQPELLSQLQTSVAMRSVWPSWVIWLLWPIGRISASSTSGTPDHPARSAAIAPPVRWVPLPSRGRWPS